MLLYSLLILSVPIFTTFCLLWLYNLKKNKLFKILAYGIWILLGCFFVTGFFYNLLNSKTTVSKENFYGSYIVDRNYFKGKNADWQYNHYRFEITKDNEFILYVTDRNKILKIFKRRLEFIEGYASPHLKVINDNRNFILESEPTLYKNSRSFYLVFKSQSYSNMFFKKGIWKPINK